jgi:hypothetical protein
MKLLGPSLVLVGGLAMASQVKAEDAQLVAPIHQFIDAFDKGDLKTAAAANDPAGVVIVDEVSPHLWTGPQAFESWAGDLMADGKAHGLSEERVDLSAATRADVDVDRAYVVAPAVFSFRQAGAATREVAQMTFVLRHGTDGWKILAWTFTGQGAQPAGK